VDNFSENPLHTSWAAILTDPVRLSVLCGLCDLETATIADLREVCHTSDPTVRRHLEALEALGLVREEPAERDGISPGRPAKTFTIDPGAAVRLCTLFDLLSEPLLPVPLPV
jgi:predicted ArsR family transcriptional regulator